MQVPKRLLFLWVVFICCWVGTAASARGSGAASLQGSCWNVIPIVAGQEQQWTFSEWSLGGWLAIEVEEPGWLAVELAPPEGSRFQASTWLELTNECGEPPLHSTKGAFLDRGLVEAKEPGTLFVHWRPVGSYDTGSWQHLRLTTQIFPFARNPDKDGEPGDDTEEDDGEVIPLTFPGPLGIRALAAGILPGPVMRLDKDGEPGDDTEEDDGEVIPLVLIPRAAASLGEGHETAEPDKDGEPGDDTEEDDGEVIPFAAPASLPELDCDVAESSGFFFCAETIVLGESHEGKLGGKGGSRKYLTFLLHEVEEVEGMLGAEGEIEVTLLDASGRIIHRVDAAWSEDVSFRTTLWPGRYFLELRASGGAAADYRISIHDLAR